MASLRCRAASLFAAASALTSAAQAAGYVDEAGCGACHPLQQRAWAASQHARAMQPATPDTVRGDFSRLRMRDGGGTTRGVHRDGGFAVETGGPGGKPGRFEVKYAFGLEPLQQYLVELSGGRLQALPLAWDVRQRSWFRLFPQETTLDLRNPLHWTRPAQNANSNCAACHTTAMRKNYRQEERRFETRWEATGVGCQACHGPAAAHLNWIRSGAQTGDDKGFGSAPTAGAQLDTCAPCHALRTQLVAAPRPGAPLLDQFLPTLLEEGRYHADGQQQDEVFIHASWLQGRMHAAGVRCGDCHDVHDGRPRLPGNALCITCHNAGSPAAGSHVATGGLQRRDYDSPRHHHHAPGAGSACVACHAPTTTYMVIDPRHDHSFRIPRPDLSLSIGTPNACNGCHRDRDAAWAQASLNLWYGAATPRATHYGVALAAGRTAAPGAASGLLHLAADAAQPPVVRATALSLLRRYPGRQARALFRQALLDVDPLVRRSAALGFEDLPPGRRVEPLAPLLTDPLRAVRIEAARLLAGSRLSAPHRADFERALAEYLEAQAENAERPQAQLALGDLHATRGDANGAEAAYREALALDAGFVPAYINLAELLRAAGREPDALSLLRSGMRAAPRQAALHEAMALALVRRGDKPAALELLRQATRLESASARTRYLHALALFDSGRGPEAMAALAQALDKHPGDRNLLLARADWQRQAGNEDAARQTLARLAAINPHDPALESGRKENP